jgi:hypothetical protein
VLGLQRAGEPAGRGRCTGINPSYDRDEVGYAALSGDEGSVELGNAESVIAIRPTLQQVPLPHSAQRRMVSTQNQGGNYCGFAMTLVVGCLIVKRDVKSSVLEFLAAHGLVA